MNLQKEFAQLIVDNYDQQEQADFYRAGREEMVLFNINKWVREMLNAPAKYTKAEIAIGFEMALDDLWAEVEAGD